MLQGYLGRWAGSNLLPFTRLSLYPSSANLDRSDVEFMTQSYQNEINMDSRVVASSDQITSQLGAESVMLNLSDGMYYGLDSIGTRIWAMLDRPRSVREICEVIQEEYEVQAPACEQAVLALLKDLNGRDLVEIRK